MLGARVTQVEVEDYQRITQRLIREAIAEWDKTGQGCFKVWVLQFVARRWLELTMSN